MSIPRATRFPVGRTMARNVWLSMKLVAPGEAKPVDGDFALDDSQGLLLGGDFTPCGAVNASADGMGTLPSASAPAVVRVVR